jgi:hypothetical protein
VARTIAFIQASFLLSPAKIASQADVIDSTCNMQTGNSGLWTGAPTA